MPGSFKKLLPLPIFLSVFTLVVVWKINSDKPIIGSDASQSSTPEVAGVRSLKLGPENFLQVMPGSHTSILDTLTAQSIVAFDNTDQKTLLSKNPQDKIPVASTLKILTAIVALDNADTQKLFTVSDKAAQVGEDSMMLEAGEKIDLKNLLYGLMLPSGNDAAVAIAEGIAGSETEFVNQMNRKADFIGMKNSYFVNASGLEGDGNDYSTAIDMTTLAVYAWQNYPLLQTIAATYDYHIEATGTHKAFDLYNETNLLTTYPGVKGFKPGYTPKAGYCLITTADINGHEIFITMLNSANRREEMHQLLDYLKTIIK